MDMKLKTLEWSPELPPDGKDHFYNHTSAVTPLGKFLITWNGYEDDPSYNLSVTPWGESFYGIHSIKEAKDWAQSEFQRRVTECFEPIEIGVTQGMVVR